MDTLDLFYRGGVAIAIGLLIGLQREYSKEEGERLFGGVRTFALIGLSGYLSALLADAYEAPVLILGGLLVLGGLLAIAYIAEIRHGQIGMTSEVAVVLTYFTGVFCLVGTLEAAAAIGVAATALLALKVQTQRLANNLTREDVMAAVKFAVITFIILPILPDRTYDYPPFDALNPYKVWLMVVLISGINFLGYVLIKIVGSERGVGLTGALGGLVSSTAVTLGFAQRSRSTDGMARAFALAILLAWAIMFARVIVEVAVVHAALLGRLWLPMAGAGLATLGYAAYLYFTERSEKQQETDDFANPFDLGPALTFAALYGVILVVVRAAQMYFGDAGIYISSILSGLADVDAITLSMAELSKAPDGPDMTTAARAIVLAALSNTVVKAGIVFSAGSKGIRAAILPGFVLILASAIGLMFFV